MARSLWLLMLKCPLPSQRDITWGIKPIFPAHYIEQLKWRHVKPIMSPNYCQHDKDNKTERVQKGKVKQQDANSPEMDLGFRSGESKKGSSPRSSKNTEGGQRPWPATSSQRSWQHPRKWYWQIFSKKTFLLQQTNKYDMTLLGQVLCQKNKFPKK